jgi:hypothetical protein
MVGCAAPYGKPEHAFMNSIFVRGDYELTYRNTAFEGATIAVYYFRRIPLHLVECEARCHEPSAKQHLDSSQ